MPIVLNFVAPEGLLDKDVPRRPSPFHRATARTTTFLEGTRPKRRQAAGWRYPCTREPRERDWVGVDRGRSGERGEPMSPGAGRAAEAVATHCPYCALQCGIRVAESPDGALVTGNAAFPVNRGQLCIKGWTATATLRHPERLTNPLVRGASGTLEPASWDQALSYVVRKLRETQARFGADSVGIFGSGALTNEKAYLLGKFARVALRTRN